MFQRIDAWLANIAVFIAPLFKLFEPLYIKLKPFQDKIVAKFYKYLKKYLKISPCDKERINSGNIVKIFRFYAVLAVVFRILFSVIIAGGSMLIVWSTLVINLPLVYLVCKGYRLAYLLLILSNTVYSVLTLVQDPKSILFIGIWWFIACSVYFFGFRFENARVEMARNGETKPLFYHLQKDIVAVILIMILTSLLSRLVSYVSMPDMPASHSDLRMNQQLNYKAGIISRSLYAYSDFCREQGYELKVYPKIFAKRFAREIEEVENELEQRDSSLSDYYNNAKRIYGRRLSESIGSELDILRRQATIDWVAQNKNIRASQIKWTQDMDNYISMVEACTLFDDIARNTVELAGQKLLSVPPSAPKNN